jgi:hypothetical protein
VEPHIVELAWLHQLVCYSPEGEEVLTWVPERGDPPTRLPRRLELAVWDGPPPPDDESARAEFWRLHERYATGAAEPPTPAVTRFLDELRRRRPDDAPAAGSFAGPPLHSTASGPLLHWWTTAGTPFQEQLLQIGLLAEKHRLVCFSPDFDSLVTRPAGAKPPLPWSREAREGRRARRTWLRGSS